MHCSDNKPNLFNIIRSIVPSRSYLALKGIAVNEYLSSMRDISRSEASRLSENIDKLKKRRYVLCDGLPIGPLQTSTWEIILNCTPLAND